MHATVRSVIEAAANQEREICILDTEASPEHLSRGTAQYADALLCIVEPYYKSLETGRRMAVLGRDLGLERVAIVANKVRDERELEAVQKFAETHDLEIAGIIPFDEQMPGAERAEASPVDFAPDTKAVMAIGEMARAVATGNGGPIPSFAPPVAVDAAGNGGSAAQPLSVEEA
jgi:CO dehydrogenase maturation factor